jgi:hypothetical protein
VLLKKRESDGQESGGLVDKVPGNLIDFSARQQRDRGMA